MTALRESATNAREIGPDPGGAVLVCAPNWLGDVLMALSAIRALCRAQPTTPLTILCKPSLVSMWSLFPEPVGVIAIDGGLRGSWRTVRRLRAQRWARAVVFPNSFRSALLPFAAGIPVRRGFRGHQRRWLLSETVRRPVSPDGPPLHQSQEYAAVAGVSPPEATGASLTVPDSLSMQVTAKWGCFLVGRVLVLFPGAAHGPSKRWPAASFAELGRCWRASVGGSVLVAGTAAEYGLCESVARGVGDQAVNLAGKTTLPELAALVSLCSMVVGNDSGGTHLAAALETPVVVVFGLTDPAVTAPRGRAVRVVAAAAEAPSRRIAGESATAQTLLATIPTAAVLAAVQALMAEFRGKDAL